MPETILQVNIRCGEKTCAHAPGEFCPLLRVDRFGRVWSCQLFRPGEHLPDIDGWLQRWPECIAAERK